MKREDQTQPNKLLGKPGLKLQINLSSEDKDDWPVNKKPSLGVEIPSEEGSPLRDNQKSNPRRFERQDVMGQPKTQFKTENDDAKSNLRDKGKTFNFGMAADFSESEEEQEDAEQINFYKGDAKNAIEEEKDDSDEEMQIHLRNNRASERVNPFG